MAKSTDSTATEASSGSTRVSASRHVVPAGRYLIFLIVASLGCYLDLLTKRLVFEWRGMPGEQDVWWIWQDFVGIETSLNTGALFGLGNDRVLWFAGFSTLALAGVIFWFVFGQLGHNLTLTVVLACISAGILGNLYDRLGLWSLNSEGQVVVHAVRDWIRLSYRSHVWPNFNLADSYLVCAASWMVWQSFHEPASAAAAAPSSPAPVPPSSSPNN